MEASGSNNHQGILNTNRTKLDSIKNIKQEAGRSFEGPLKYPGFSPLAIEALNLKR